MLTNASPRSSPRLELPLRAATLLIASYLPKYLHTNIFGVVLSDDLFWKPHVLPVVARSNRLLGFLKRTFGYHSKALFTGYKAMIRPIPEYACQAWNPHQAHLIEKLECVQRNVTRWIVGKDIPYEDRLKSLKLPTLVQRREYLSLVQLFTFIKGHSSVNTNDYISFSNR